MSASHSKEQTQIFGMTVGAEPKKVAALGALLVIFVIVWFVTRSSDDSSAGAQQTAAAGKTAGGLKGAPDPDTVAGRPSAATSGRRSDLPGGGPKRVGSRQALTTGLKEFHPSQKPDKDNPIDPSRTDPTIRFDSLAKVQSVSMAGGGRSLFEFGSMAPVVDPTKPSTIVKPKPIFLAYGPAKPEPIPPPPPAPPPPAIPLKFYGFVNTARTGERRAFFMENEDIYIAGEGEMIKKRYKLVKIGVNSVVLEDTQYKNNQQTIKLTEEAQTPGL